MNGTTSETRKIFGIYDVHAPESPVGFVSATDDADALSRYSVGQGFAPYADENADSDDDLPRIVRLFDGTATGVFTNTEITSREVEKPTREAVAEAAYVAAYEDPYWGLKTSEEDVLCSILEAVYEFPTDRRRTIDIVRAEPLFASAADWIFEVAAREQDLAKIVAELLPMLDDALFRSHLAIAGAFGLEVDPDGCDPYFLATALYEVRSVPEAHRAAAVAHINEGNDLSTFEPPRDYVNREALRASSEAELREIIEQGGPVELIVAARDELERKTTERNLEAATALDPADVEDEKTLCTVHAAGECPPACVHAYALEDEQEDLCPICGHDLALHPNREMCDLGTDDPAAFSPAAPALLEIERKIAGADRDIARLVAELRRDLDRVEGALEQDLRVASSVSGEPFLASTARDLVRAIEKRQTSYDERATIESLFGRR